MTTIDAATPESPLEALLRPLDVDLTRIVELTNDFTETFTHLAAHSLDQFLATPISESILRPAPGRDYGRGGTNLRVGFIELSGAQDDRHLERLLEQSWSIQNHLKSENSESLFSWIGARIAEVVAKGCEAFNLPPTTPIPMGVTFSFPIHQSSLSEATLLPMGKGFAITSHLDLGAHLTRGYDQHRTPGLPPSASPPSPTTPLHPSKQPAAICVVPGDLAADRVRIAVNTEWGINGTAPPLRRLGFVTRWDEALDAAGEAPGFQPLEYMTAGRYLGELARLVFLEYLAAAEGVDAEVLPAGLRQRFGLTTTFASFVFPGGPRGPVVEQLGAEFPPAEGTGFRWTEAHGDALHRIAKAIERRAAGIVAAATVGLLRSAGEIPDQVTGGEVEELVVGYTGGCIQYFQDYLKDAQGFLDGIMEAYKPMRVRLSPCHDGGITGAGILVPAAMAGEEVRN
ncbi:hypothetical protein B0T18DRAFT_401407 [Schizothecium vesticola]|uniref:Phosphotransferase n=1 Tax=Schizothecium vesticola TaxID=314040 RepID=A0AA40K9L4_9PEZI|nr:hypothetical protein B0T18DRAFT_401407 [Schizothecium vesticola]